MTTAFGLDFGTTNSVLATACGTSTQSVRLDTPVGEADTLRTALSFLKKNAHELSFEAGQAAIAQFIDNPGECRFLQSIKTFAASPLFQGTLVFAKRYQFEDIMHAFLSRLRDYAGAAFDGQAGRVVVGRPVRFAGSNPDEALATERYNAALTRFGFPEIHHVYEPVAAAFYFARNLDRDATVLVADFGGGTTDYSLIRFESHAGRLTATPLGHSGVGVAGDNFDFRIIDNIVSPVIGKGTRFKSFDKLLEVPSGYYANFGRWNQLSIFKTLRDFAELKKLVRVSLEPEKLEAFVDLIEHDEGYPLYQAVSATKMRLSTAEETEFSFGPLGDKATRTVLRSDFEQWIAPELERIEDALDDVLAKTNTESGDIDKVFLTGGTSFVPAVRRLFEQRFARDRIESGGELLSIAHGLALIGERDDIADWTAKLS
ncbi:putative chaperone protein [Mycoplana sp. BE70]|uniref:Hsp70 family protein n=1 Tax=Mycoplana sp. BE70 TaxID=2817775 RepID=UPI00285A1892|nr:Hsp70 family protein [Mycoplana sp. BE70]MDR6757244.1 putative chaperone protein [Mycoplana sp. BE70]